MSYPREPGHRRVEVTLACSACNSRNYKAKRPRQDGTEPLRLKKFCATCGAHTVHVQSL